MQSDLWISFAASAWEYKEQIQELQDLKGPVQP